MQVICVFVLRIRRLVKDIQCLNEFQQEKHVQNFSEKTKIKAVS